MRKLLSVDLQLIASGLMPGLNPEAVPLWADGRNIQFDSHGVRAMRGYAAPLLNSGLFDSHAGLFDSAAGLFDDAGGGDTPLVSPAGSSIRGLIAYTLDSSGVTRAAFATVDKVWKWDGGSAVAEIDSGLTGITDDLDTGEKASYYYMINWGDWFAYTNGVNNIKLYKTGASAAALTGSPPPKAKILAKLGPHVLAINTGSHTIGAFTVGGVNWIEWCAEDDIEQWDFTVNVTAGNLTIRDMKGEPTCAKKLGEGLAIYTPSEMQRLDYIGGLFLFGTKPLLEGVGALGPHSVVSDGAKNYGLYYNGVFVTDGYTYNTLTYPKFGRWFEKHVNLDQKSKIVGWNEINQEEVRFAVPVDGSKHPNLIISVNKKTGAFSFLDQAVSFGIAPGPLHRALVGTVNGDIFYTDATDDPVFDGAQINSYVQTKPIDLSVRDTWKTIQQIKFILNDLTNVAVDIGWQEKLEDPINWLPAYEFTQINPEIFPQMGCIYISFRFRSVQPNAQWKLEGFDAWGVDNGRRF